MEEQLFNKIRDQLSQKDFQIKAGKMMSSEAITYKNKVFAFLSRKKKMVFKLGKDFNTEHERFEINVFNPFKKRSPLNGWFEVPYTEKEHWESLSIKALNFLKNEL